MLHTNPLDSQMETKHFLKCWLYMSFSNLSLLDTNNNHLRKLLTLPGAQHKGPNFERAPSRKPELSKRSPEMKPLNWLIPVKQTIYVHIYIYI